MRHWITIGDVAKPPEFAAAEAKVALKRSEIEQALVRLRDAQAKNEARVGIPGELEAANRTVLKLETEARELQSAVDKNKPSYTAAARAAVLPHRQAQARRVLAAISELASACERLDQTALLITAAGGSPLRLPRVPYLDGIADLPRKVVLEGDG